MRGIGGWLSYLPFLFSASVAAGSGQNVLMNHKLSFEPDWEVLGPFKLGTRGTEDIAPQIMLLTFSRGYMAV
jgi:hypothetical protein